MASKKAKKCCKKFKEGDPCKKCPRQKRWLQSRVWERRAPARPGLPSRPVCRPAIARWPLPLRLSGVMQCSSVR